MRIKRFTGQTTGEAMRSVKAELGPGALILGTRRLGSGLHEVTAAVDYDLSDQAAALSAPVPDVATAQAGRETLSGEIRKELGELRDLKRLCMAFVTNSGGPMSDVFNRIEENLVKTGIDRRLARKILMNTLSGVTKEKAVDIAYLKSCIRKKVYDRISVKDPLAARGAVAFVGPSGVGKTTTIAKLAAMSALRKNMRTALITMDTFRIAAAEQLKVYGRLMGLPVEVARDTSEIKSFIKAHGDKDLILIDTAGRSQKDRARMDELKALAKAAPEVRFNLVLNTQTRDEAMYESVKGFGELPLDSLTFTRLDEGGGVYGPILNAMILARKPVAYLSTGARVPEDIEPASKDRLIDFLMPKMN